MQTQDGLCYLAFSCYPGKVRMVMPNIHLNYQKMVKLHKVCYVKH